MHKRGVIRWFGGHNKKTGKVNNFGFIEQDNDTDVKVYAEGFSDCDINQVKKGLLVKFELREGKSGKLVAFNVSPIREIGKIAKLIHGDKYDYGFITREGSRDLYFKLKSFQGPQKLAKEDGYVFYNQILKQDNREEATNIFPLQISQEMSIDIIDLCLSKGDLEILKLIIEERIIDRYINLKPVDYLINKIHDFLERPRYRGFRDDDFIKKIPSKILMDSAAKKLRDKLSIWNSIDLYNRMILCQPSEVGNEIIYNEIIEKLENIEKIHKYREDEWSNIPSAIFDAHQYRKRLKSNVHIYVICRKIESSTSQSEISLLIMELQSCLLKSIEVDIIWEDIPDDIIKTPEIWDVTPNDRRVKTFINQLSNEAIWSESQKKIISNIASILGDEQEDKRCQLTNLLQKKAWVKKDASIFKYLSDYEKITILIQSAKDEENNEKIASKIAKILSSSAADNAVKNFILNAPDILRFQPILFNFLPSSEKIDRLLDDDCLKFDDKKLKIFEIVKSSKDCIEELLEIVPQEMRIESPFHILFSSVQPYKQVEWLWELLILSDKEAWNKLCYRAKILCIYRFAQEGVEVNLENITKNISSKQQHPLVVAVLLLFRAIKKEMNRGKVFECFHEIVQNYVVSEAWSSLEPLDLFPLLPKCRPGLLPYCEGRPWKKNVAFCSRPKLACAVFDPTRTKSLYPENYPNWRPELQGARLEAECSQNWRNWSILELLSLAKIIPNVEGLTSSLDYVPRLSGWVNRLNEIREHLQCSVCSEIMVPNYEYAKNLARYNMTVASCKHGLGHDQNVYLNHCWNCRRIIDSRECNSRDSGYYICPSCGAGRPGEGGYNHYSERDVW